jgi:hypothetical protein
LYNFQFQKRLYCGGVKFICCNKTSINDVDERREKGKVGEEDDVILKSYFALMAYFSGNNEWGELNGGCGKKLEQLRLLTFHFRRHADAPNGPSSDNDPPRGRRSWPASEVNRLPSSGRGVSAGRVYRLLYFIMR